MESREKYERLWSSIKTAVEKLVSKVCEFFKPIFKQAIQAREGVKKRDYMRSSWNVPMDTSRTCQNFYQKPAYNIRRLM